MGCEAAGEVNSESVGIAALGVDSVNRKLLVKPVCRNLVVQ